MTVNKPIPAKIFIAVNGETVTHDLADHKDWGIMDGSTLSVSTEEEDFYYPLDSVTHWSVKAYRKRISHFTPKEVNLLVKDEPKAAEGH
jgi:hypothetical protein